MCTDKESGSVSAEKGKEEISGKGPREKGIMKAGGKDRGGARREMEVRDPYSEH